MDASKTLVDFSPIESEEFKMKVGRVASEEFDSESLKRILLEEEYDLCRLKVQSATEDTILKLEGMGLPFYFSASIRRYKTAIKDIPDGKFLHDDIIYEKYDRSKDDLLYEMLVDCWGDYPMGYYRTPYLSDLVSKEQEIQCVYLYYQKYNLQTDFPNNTIMFMKHKNEYVGFFALNVIDDRLESHIGGILKPYQKFGYFYDMQEYIRRFCLDNELAHFCFGARNENGRVQSIFRKYGYKAYGTENVFHITPCMSRIENSPFNIEGTINFQSDQKHLMYKQLLDEFLEQHHELLPKDATNLEFNSVNINQLSKGKHRLKIDKVLSSSLMDLTRLKIYNENKLAAVVFAKSSY